MWPGTALTSQLSYTSGSWYTSIHYSFKNINGSRYALSQAICLLDSMHAKGQAAASTQLSDVGTLITLSLSTD